ncbi:MAG: DUF1028 domain-containing protein [Phycisphaerales bacterium]|nr:DUF1028 domain-containing protein [Phycisphaerales bacterium]
MALFDRSLFAIGCTATALLSTPANATWSILIADTRTGEIVIGSATCVESIDLQQETPVLISGVGAVTAQSAVDTSGMNRQLIRDRLLQGVPLGAILDELSMIDAGHANRQYGMINTFGGTLTYSGVHNAAWAGGQTGRIERGIPGPQEDIVFTVQGNILSGANVVQAAVDAIVASDGDLPQMMMEAMQAAKVAGGDGRCSCSNADPTGCGSPPPAPFKSADVGYMLGTRAGDIDAIRAIYPIEGFVGALATMDLDGDGFEEVIVGNRDTDEISVFLNTSSAGVPLSSLELMGTIDAPSSGVVDMDVSLGRVLVAFADPPRLGLYGPDGGGSIELLDVVDLPGNPVGLASGLLDPETHGVSIDAPGQVQFFDGFGDEIELTNSLDLGYAPGRIALGQLVGDGHNDLLVPDGGGSMVHVYAGREGGFDLDASIATANSPVAVTAADMDSDGDNEIVVLCGAGRAVQIFRFENDAWTQWASLNIGGVGIGLDVGDMNGDGFPDVISTVQATNRNLRLWISDGQGEFSLQSRTRVGSAARSIALADMNLNGDLDIVVGNAGDEAVMVLDNPRGGEIPQPGRFADGSYFMALNVPNQRRSDPDPVDQLQDLYDAWRLDREGRVDAVRSSVSGYSVLTLGNSEVFTIELRDLHGNLLDITDASELQVEVRDPFATAGQPVLIGPGVFEIELTGGDVIGQTRLVVHAGMGDDAVRLMPDIAISVSAFIADFNADGMCNFFDVSSYLAAYFSWDIRADINRDGFIDFRDASAFLQSYGACSGG